MAAMSKWAKGSAGKQTNVARYQKDRAIADLATNRAMQNKASNVSGMLHDRAASAHREAAKSARAADWGGKTAASHEEMADRHMAMAQGKPDPGYGSSGGDDRPRDEHGRFASK